MAQSSSPAATTAAAIAVKAVAGHYNGISNVILKISLERRRTTTNTHNVVYLRMDWAVSVNNNRITTTE